MNETELTKANKLFRKKKYIEALELYSKIVLDNPKMACFLDVNMNISKKRASAVSSCNSIERDSEEFTNGIFVGIASIPSRQLALKETIESLIHQVDNIGIYLDGYANIPEYLSHYGSKIRYIHSDDIDRDLGDAGKFLWAERHQGHYFTCDDDLIYPPDYIDRTITCIWSYSNPVVIGWHGSLILNPFKDFYDKDSRRVFSFRTPRSKNLNVHILGTGCLGFYTQHITVKLNDFETPNMADVYFALLAQKQRVPLIVIQHERDEIMEIKSSQDISIYKHSSNETSNSRQNTKKMQNFLVSNHRWNLNLPDHRLRIAIIGRFKINPKGGIFKSSRLLANSLTNLGHDIGEYCISDTKKLEALTVAQPFPDLVLAYAPDPQRPDFGALLDLITDLARKGSVCAINFSINSTHDRSKWIAEYVRVCNVEFDRPRVFVAAFTNSSSLIDCHLRSISKYIVTIPKTLDPGVLIEKSYANREGIFIGDLAKLLNQDITFDDARKWIEQIRIRLPHVNIYALKHYHTNKVFLNYIKIIPYEPSGLSSILSNFKLCICLTPGATFEMIPVEAAMLGTPVIHREMPQSLSEYLSPVSIEASNPYEFGQICAQLYEREELWNRFSLASKGLYNALHVNNISAAIEIGIRKCISRSKLPETKE